MKFYSFLCIVLIAFGASALDANAQDKNLEVKKDKDILFKHVDGYSVKFPFGWLSLSKDLPEDDKASFLAAAKGKYNVDDLDAVFIDPKSMQDDVKYERNIIIRKIPLNINIDTFDRAKFKGFLVNVFSKVYERHELLAYDVLNINGKKMINSEFKGTLGGLEIYNRQIFVLFKSQLLMINCATAQKDVAPFREQCERVAQSLTF